MSVKKIGPSKWRVGYRDLDRKQRYKTFTKERDATAYDAQIKTELSSGTFIGVKASATTFTEFCTEWFPRQVWAPNTLKQYDVVLRTVPFAKIPLGQIRRSHIEQWVKQMMAEGKAPSTINNRVKKIRRILQAAGPNGDNLINGINVAQGVKGPRSGIHEVELDEIPSDKLIAELLAKSTGQAQALFALCAFAGLRAGEACGIQVSDIDFLHRVIHIRRQIQPVKGAGDEVRLPKGGKMRKVPLSTELGDILAWHIREVGTHGDERWLFANYRGKRANHTTVNWQWMKFTADIPGFEPFTPHSLRHYYASSLINDGCAVPLVSKALGHGTIAFTLAVYTHVFPDADEQIRAASDAAMRRVGAFQRGLGDSLVTAAR